MKSHVIKESLISESLQCSIKQFLKIGFVFSILSSKFAKWGLAIPEAGVYFSVVALKLLHTGALRLHSHRKMMLQGTCWRYVCRAWLTLYFKSLKRRMSAAAAEDYGWDNNTAMYFCYHCLKMFTIRFLVDLS